mmetsp:Transcript_46116/g.128239  ORF Transcript_46116/g.128239 Transcript_46116/m.128239 type:complete len:657 (-) Transcript_46116:104-2074(-)|eukprot:CAMPEP_0117575932 /NCGR_PEP_ID=MMETSP0784-20121206/62500_1 /TAXON_ID=39447 /ORGANISM="" /LENGTH=656 /DNA_ID=CAMNT_0005375095 /DNA_START=32 /DNA_END=2002 /DNA_ORIENTATION=+
MALGAADDDDLVEEYPWDEEGEEVPEVEEEAAPDEEYEEYDAEGDVEAAAEDGAEAGVEDVEFAWDGDEAEAAAANVEVDMAFELLNQDYDVNNDGRHERALLAKLRRDLKSFLHPQKFELEPFGSYVTDLGLPTGEGKGQSDLDVVLLFHGEHADSFETKEIRNRVVLPNIDRLGQWLRQRRDVTVKNIIRKARVPIVTFSTQELEVDVSVQQPWGVLNSWHLRDLCASGRPGRLRSLVRMVKLWAKSKSIHTAKDGSLSSYGYAMLAAGYLREYGALPALLPEGRPQGSPYLDSDGALKHVLGACKAASAAGAHDGGADARRRTELWREPEVLPAGASEEADATPVDLFWGWLEWFYSTVMGFVPKGAMASSCGTIPLAKRHIVSVRPRSQQELRVDITWSNKRAEHWSPASQEVYLLIEEPLSGENVARCVKSSGFWAIRAEVERAREFLTERLEDGERGEDGGLAVLKELFDLPPLATREQLPNGVGLPGHRDRFKRPFDGGGGEEPPHKRPFGMAGGPHWSHGARQPWGYGARPQGFPPRPPGLPPRPPIRARPVGIVKQTTTSPAAASAARPPAARGGSTGARPAMPAGVLAPSGPKASQKLLLVQAEKAKPLLKPSQPKRPPPAHLMGGSQPRPSVGRGVIKNLLASNA